MQSELDENRPREASHYAVSWVMTEVKVNWSPLPPTACCNQWMKTSPNTKKFKESIQPHALPRDVVEELVQFKSLSYERKNSKPDFRMGRVLEVKIDNSQLVRTVFIGMRPRDSREKSLPYKIKNLYRVNLPVQRLTVTTPAEELPGTVPVE